MYTINKIPSKLKGPYVVSDLPTVEFSNMGLVDMNESYIELPCTIDNASPTAGAKPGIYEVMVVSGTNNISYTNSVLLKQLQHTMNGDKVQATDDLNVLTQNIAQYTRNFEQKSSENYDNITQFNLTNNALVLNGQPKMWRHINLSGTTPSFNNTVSLRIPCRDVMSMGRMVLPTDGIQHKVKANIDISNLTVINYRPYSNHNVVANRLDFNNFVVGAGGALDAGTIANPLITADDYPDGDWKIFVGQAVNIDFENDGVAGNKSVVITSIEVDAATDKLKVAFDEPIASVAATKSLTLITLISELYGGTNLLKVNSFNLVLKSLHPDDKRAKKLAGATTLKYSDWVLERFNMDTSVDWNKMFTLDQNCMNAIIMTPTTTLISHRDQLYYYRLAIDGIETTDKNIAYGYGHYNNELIRLFNNLGKTQITDGKNAKDKKYKNNYELNNLESEYDTAGNLKFIMPVTVTNKDTTQLLQVTIHNGAPMTAKTGYLWKQILKTVKVSGK